MLEKIKEMIASGWTTAFGTIAGVPEIIQGWTSQPKDWMLIIKGIALLLMGIAAKDAGKEAVSGKQPEP